MDSENTTRNIVKEVMRECHHLQLNENFVTYYAKLLQLDPNWGISKDLMTNRGDVQKFVKYIVDTLVVEESPSLVALNLQFYFTCNLDDKSKIISKYRNYMQMKLLPLENEILEYKIDENNNESIPKLYRKITFYVTLNSELGNPLNENVYLEVLYALKSVMFEDELEEFTNFSTVKKQENLIQTEKLVRGVRLYNKECHKAGEGIDDLPAMLESSIQMMKSDLEFSLLTIVDRVNLLTTAVDVCHVVQKEHLKWTTVCVAPEGVSEKQIENTKELLAFYRQCELFIRKLVINVDETQVKVTYSLKALNRCFETIHDVTRLRTAILSSTIFPLFEKLADIWRDLQNLSLIISKFNEVLENLHKYTRQLPFDYDLLELLLCEENQMTDAQRMEKYSDFVITTSNEDVKIFMLDDDDVDKDEIKFEYLGFCCWKLVETEGGLIPGNPNMGIVSFKNKNYVFSCPEAAECFLEDPQQRILKVLDLLRRKPHLINFLEQREELFDIKDVVKLVEKNVVVRICMDQIAQTETSYVKEPGIEPKYHWNVWDLKREALQLATLSQYKTVSTQTDKFYSRCPVRTQTYLSKEKCMQTKRDNYSNVPKPSTFIAGLRGRKDDKQFIIDLTRPVDE